MRRTSSAAVMGLALAAWLGFGQACFAQGAAGNQGGNNPKKTRQFPGVSGGYLGSVGQPGINFNNPFSPNNPWLNNPWNNFWQNPWQNNPWQNPWQSPFSPWNPWQNPFNPWNPWQNPVNPWNPNPFNPWFAPPFFGPGFQFGGFGGLGGGFGALGGLGGLRP